MENSSLNDTTQLLGETLLQNTVGIVGESLVDASLIDSVIDSKSEITKTLQNASLDVLLRIIITSKISTISVSIDNTVSAILLELLDKSPKVFDRIQESVQLIVQDGKLNAADIPHLYNVITEVYPLVKKSKTRPSSLDCAKIVGTIVKVVIHVLVSEHKIKVSNTSEFLKQVDGLVDNAIELVSLAKTVKQQSLGCYKIFMRRK